MIPVKTENQQQPVQQAICWDTRSGVCAHAQQAANTFRTQRENQKNKPNKPQKKLWCVQDYEPILISCREILRHIIIISL